MLHIHIDDLTEAHLQRLAADQIPESVHLEFKRELKLTSTGHKKEFAKDLSALANSAGGRIIYGIEEVQRPDGSKIAGPITPLTNGQLEESSENILTTTISPRLAYRVKRIDVTGGFVLVFEVLSSYGRDLHMVTGYGDQRFYRRGERRVIEMEEPEIREAYQRIAVAIQAIETEVQSGIDREIRSRPLAQESVFVAPLFGRWNLADPKLIREVRHDLADGPLGEYNPNGEIRSLQVHSGGMRAVIPNDEEVEDADSYFGVDRSGLVTLSHQTTIFDRDGELRYLPKRSLVMLDQSIRSARIVLDKCGYWGPVRIVHRLQIPDADRPVVFQVGKVISSDYIPGGQYTSVVPETDVRQIGSNRNQIMKEILDQVYQAAGLPECDLFDST